MLQRGDDVILVSRTVKASLTEVTAADGRLWETLFAHAHSRFNEVPVELRTLIFPSSYSQ